MTEGLNTAGRWATIRRAGLAMVLASACGRVVVTHDPLPGWSVDPMSGAVATNGIGPSGELLLAALSCFGLAAVLLAAAAHRERLPAATLALFAIGLIAVIYHGWIGPGASVESASIGGSWAGALAGGLAAFIACRHASERALTIGVCGAIVAPLVARAGIQVYSEHPAVVEDFRQRKAEILRSQGWSEGSARAKAYERRLLTPDASGWLAMSNVYASMMAASAALGAGAAIAAIRSGAWRSGVRVDRYRVAGVIAVPAIAVVGLFLAVPAGGALPKGGVAALGVGLALLALVGMRGTLPRRAQTVLSGPAIGVGVVVAALVAIAVRGVIGDAIGELSLWFRWFYVQAASTIFVEHPLWGVGPDGFQQAYLLAKNPMNPEQVASPHSVFFEFAATLGLAGLAWCALLWLMAARAGQQLTRPDASSSAVGPMLRGWLAAVALACIALSFSREALPRALSVEGAFGLLLVDGMTKSVAYAALWLLLGLALSSFAHSRWARAGLAAGALSVLTHSQIELTATDLSAAAWAFALVGSACAHQADTENRKSRTGRLAGIGALAGGVGLLVAAVPVVSWELQLRRASREVSEASALATRFELLATRRSTESPAQFLEALTSAAGRPVASDGEAIADALDEIRIRAAANAADSLERVSRSRWTPSPATTRAAVRVRGGEAALRGGSAAPDAATLQRGFALARWATERWSTDSRAWRQLAQLSAALGDPAGASDQLLVAAGLDPHSPWLALEVAEALAVLGDLTGAQEWADRALHADAAMRLDPLAGLSDRQRERAQELAGAP